jgi:nitrite reductase (NADH) large subunit
MRTATWLNKMEGGLEYLYDVIVNDSLGIAADLEKEMQCLIDNYHCEWKKAVENPEMRERFRHFVNVGEEADPTLEFVDMRGQKCPVDWNTLKS